MELVRSLNQPEYGNTGTLNESIREKRLALGLRLADVSERTAEWGHRVSVARLSRIERGVQDLWAKDLQVIGYALGVAPADLHSGFTDHPLNPEDDAFRPFVPNHYIYRPTTNRDAWKAATERLAFIARAAKYLTSITAAIERGENDIAYLEEQLSRVPADLRGSRRRINEQLKGSRADLARIRPDMAATDGMDEALRVARVAHSLLVGLDPLTRPADS